ncbi:MAG TPA: CHASE4 domain-containing protein, partial [candidate division Zixibacteria bacterium]|nr:CHASE4 domain-containing protein [candidate division Zixibacteria bacterium]
MRKKTLLIISITLITLIVFLYTITSAVVSNGFSQVEKRDTMKNVDRVNDALSDELSVLSGVVGDWAAWNETYTFVNGENPNFVEEQIADRTFIEIRLNLVLFINSTGGVTYGSAFDLKNETAVPIPESIREYLSADSILLRHQDTQSSVTGIINLPEGPMLVASRPILTNEREGPIRGSVIWGRYLNDEKINMIGTKTHLNITMHRLDDTKLPSDFLFARDSFSEHEEILVRPLNEEAIAGYTLLNDVHGAPALIMRVAMPRDIFNQGQVGIRYLLISLIVLGLIFGILTIWLLDRLIISRLFHLNSDVIGIGATKELSERVAVEGGDELSSLADSINSMLGALQHSQFERQEVEKELRAHRDQLAYVSKAKSEFLSTMSHELRTPLNSIIGFSELLKEGMYGDLNTKQTHYVENVLTSSKFLLNLINDILDLSKVEAGKIELVIEKMPVPGTISETIVLIKEKASKHNVCVEQDLDPQLDFIEADKQRFKQILFNLLSNAIKFSKKEGGTVTIATKKEEDMAKFSVADTGIG